MLEWEAHSQPLLFSEAGETQGDMITSNGQAEKIHLRLVNMTLGASTQPSVLLTHVLVRPASTAKH